MRTVEEIVKTSFVKDISVETARSIFKNFDELIVEASKLYTEKEIKELAAIICISFGYFDFTKSLNSLYDFEAPLDQLQKFCYITKSSVKDKCYYSLCLTGASKLIFLNKHGIIDRSTAIADVCGGISFRRLQTNFGGC